RTSGLTEIATAFFPRKVAGVQSAYRLSEGGWVAILRIERLGQTIQSDVLHIFSIGEGIAYGSSVLNYTISGAPVSTFRVELSDEYFNVEFTGKDVRNWQKVPGGYQVQLHTPVAGAYTLLATYERPFKSQGDTLTFTGARPLDVQSEQGHTLVISAYQFQVKPVDVSAGLLALEPGEVPSDYRLLFDAPVLAAYRYLTRPFNLRLALSPLAQADSLSLVIDRASLTTRISKEGQVLTDARYFIKNRGNPHLRLTLPSGTRLWSVTVNGSPVVPVTDASSDLVPLPRGTDPNAVLTVDFKLASVSSTAKRVFVAIPVVNAPVMLAEWHLNADIGQRLFYRRGSLTPVGPSGDNSGFAQLAHAFGRAELGRPVGLLSAGISFLVLAMLALRWAAGASFRFNARHLAGLALAALALVAALVILNEFSSQLTPIQSQAPRDLTFVAPVQQPGSALSLEVLNLEDKPSFIRQSVSAWPILLVVPVWAFAASLRSNRLKGPAIAFGWLLLAWTGLRLTNGVRWFGVVIAAFFIVHAVLPLVMRSLRRPLQKDNLGVSTASAGSASAAILLLLGLFLSSGLGGLAEPATGSRSASMGTADLVLHEIRVEEQFGYATAKLHWEADKGQKLSLLLDPAVLTGITYPAEALRLERVLCTENSGSTQQESNSSWMQRLVAKRRGSFDVDIRYELPVIHREDQMGFYLPVPAGVINRLKLTIVNREVQILSPQAVSMRSEASSTNTIADVVLAPSAAPWIGWKPRTRDLKHEKPTFYAELSQLYVPSTGVIEAEH
ncbi:MAG TPA: hypothetical protein VL793_06000, partial [Patescibacteria group bacterium]|nr:hypothetical protein [Patescibacteria group bacterium]